MYYYQAQKNGFSGKKIGAKPQTGNYRKWTADQLKEGENIIGIQAGTNKFASQKGMSFGVRNIATNKRKPLLNGEENFNKIEFYCTFGSFRMNYENWMVSTTP